MEATVTALPRFLFPDVWSIQEREAVFLFQTSGRPKVRCASDCSYEVWLSADKDWRSGSLIGVGGHRCTMGEAYVDEWEGEPDRPVFTVRLHWLNPRGNRKLFGYEANVLYRSVFPESFLADLDPQGGDQGGWTCYRDTGLRLGVKMSTQLARQNIVTAGRPARLELVEQSHLARQWQLVPLPVRRLEVVHVDTQHTMDNATLGARPTAARARNGRAGMPRPDKRASSVKREAQYVPPPTKERREGPDEGEDVLSFAQESGWPVRTIDLGEIGFHRFSVDVDHGGCVVLCYSEVADFARAWATSNRKKVRMADAFTAPGTTAGSRGCRYVHAVSRPGKQYCVRAVRLVYPFRWKALPFRSAECDALAEACRANLRACVDGGVVDTCWREAVQWTGDLRMAAKALRVLTEDTEIVALALHQIADSYDPARGMVQGAWPCGTPQFRLEMPTYHLAFCLAACEHDPTLEFDAKVARVVRESVCLWRERYVREGLLTGVLGWTFTDWDPAEPGVQGRATVKNGRHAVLHAWWMELCGMLGEDAVIDPSAFDATFWTGAGYRLWSCDRGPNAHATAAVVSSGVGRRGKEAARHLRAMVSEDCGRSRITAYYAYFVALALHRHGPSEGKRYLRDYYGPIARRHGTIYEKTSSDASMAHGWSIAFVELLARQADDRSSDAKSSGQPQG